MRSFLFFTVPLCVLGAACGDDDAADDSTTTTATSTSTGSGGEGGEGGAGGGTGGEGGEGGQFVPTCMRTPGIVLALDTLLMGDTDPDGTESQTAWRQYGFDIDGKVTTASSVDVCKPAAGGVPDDAYPDGDNGIDNSFGRNVLPLFKAFLQTPTKTMNANIASGAFTMMFRMDELARGPDTPTLETLVYGGAPLGSDAKFDGTDCWPVLQELLEDVTNIDSSKIVLPQTSVAADLWSSGPPGTLNLQIPAGPGTLNLVIHSARLSMQLAADHASSTEGRLGGVLETEQFVGEVKKLAGALSPAFCSGPIIDNIIENIRKSSDIMKDGTQNPNATCDGISIGLGFSTKRVELGGIHPPVKPSDDPCAMQ